MDSRTRKYAETLDDIAATAGRALGEANCETSAFIDLAAVLLLAADEADFERSPEERMAEFTAVLQSVRAMPEHVTHAEAVATVRSGCGWSDD